MPFVIYTFHHFTTLFFIILQCGPFPQKENKNNGEITYTLWVWLENG